MNRTPRKTNEHSLLYAFTLFVPLGVTIWFLCALLCAFVAMRTPSPKELVFPSGILCVFVGSFLSVLFCALRAKKEKERPLLPPLCVAAFLIVALAVGSLFFPNEEGRTLLARLTSPCVSAVASALGLLCARAKKQTSAKRLKKLKKRLR